MTNDQARTILRASLFASAGLCAFAGGPVMAASAATATYGLLRAVKEVKAGKAPLLDRLSKPTILCLAASIPAGVLTGGLILFGAATLLAVAAFNVGAKKRGEGPEEGRPKPVEDRAAPTGVVHKPRPQVPEKHIVSTRKAGPAPSRSQAYRPNAQGQYAGTL